MQQVQLPDQLYQQARQRATEAGFQSVDEYVAEIVESEVSAAAENYDDFFTPEIVAKLDQIHAEMKAGGKTFTADEVDAHFRRKSQAWRETHGVAHADRYISFLRAATEKLSRSQRPGRPVPHHNSFRYALIKRRRRARYGHLVVFAIEGETFRVVRYFHTSQDWQSQMTVTNPG